MPYDWTSTTAIQLHLSTQSTIIISATPTNPQDYDEALAMQWENYAVRYITEWLSIGWNIGPKSTPTGRLIDITARFTAALIGIDKLTVQFGSAGPGAWTTLYLNDVHNRLMSILLNHSTITLDSTMIKKRLTFEQQVFAAKSRNTKYLIDMLTR